MYPPRRVYFLIVSESTGLRAAVQRRLASCGLISRAVATGSVLVSLVLAGACKADRPLDSPVPTDSKAPTAPGAVRGFGSGLAEWFTDRAAETGLTFVHDNGTSGEFLFPEIMMAGVALLDYDGDGDLDVFLVQGGTLRPNKGPAGKGVRPAPSGSRLYRNDLQLRADGTRPLQFVDVTEASGIAVGGYGMGAAAGDFTNDGCVDLYVTTVGHNQLFRNNCDGTFTDVSARSGTSVPGWSVSAAFVDYDRDGWLDLFVGNYVQYSVEADLKCPGLVGGRDYCPPRVYHAQPSRLFRNRGNGTFADVTTRALVGGEFGPALGVSTADFDGDGWMDIYVANDGAENQLWMNQRNGTLRNTALVAGAALNVTGKAEAGMGVDAGDFDNDGDEDIFITHLTTETNTLYVNNGSGVFQDLSARSGLGPPSLAYTGFGTAWIDFDNDGWLDVLTVNGTVQRVDTPSRSSFPYDQRKQLFRNLGSGRFEEVTDRAGGVFSVSSVGRGAAFGDLDNDGDTDVVVANANGPVELLVNNAGSRNHWLGLRLEGGANAPRDMLGARVAVARTGTPTLWRRARSDGSYGSANDPRVLVGLGESPEIPTLRVIWPSGRVEEWGNVPIDRWTTIQEGSGR
jgi:hypothetical protein